MEGSNDVEGMIALTVKQLFEAKDKLEELGWQYSIRCSFVEIYNETLRDLLSRSSAESSDQKLQILHHKDGKTEVVGATYHTVSDICEVSRILNLARKQRSVGATQANARSSRSHSVFSITLTAKNVITHAESHGVLNLVDLAGSERLKQSKSTGVRLKETQAINKSLSALGDVIAALANSDAHVPYRNSKLTYLLQNSLGGSSSKTLMFVNCSPRYEDLSETLSSLRFAVKVNACQINHSGVKKGGRVDLN